MTTPNVIKADATPQERLVQAINDNQALALILSDLFDKNDVRQEFLSRQLIFNSDRITRALAAWQKELSSDDEVGGVKWQPIETVPTGTAILVYGEKGEGIHLAVVEPCNGSVMVAYDEVDRSLSFATHWMPLPEAPEAYHD